MNLKMKKAFTMIELIFVIIIIGILSAVAIPKFNATRNDAVITKAKVTVASIRNAISTERQLRRLRGDFTAISSLDTHGTTAGGDIFDFFDGNLSKNRILEYTMKACKSGASGCWIKTVGGFYQFKVPSGTNVNFTLANNRFDCNATDGTSGPDCILLTQ